MNEIINQLEKYCNLANYLCVKSMYLKENIDENELKLENIKDKVSGHWGNVSQINFLYAHLNYFMKKYDREVGLIIGTGHAGLPLLINMLIDGSLQKFYKNISIDDVIRNFGQSNGFRSEINPEYPGTIYDGGELGYALGVSFGSVLRSNRIVFCLIGDGECETGTTSSSFLLSKILDNRKDGVVVPVINLNGFKMGGTSLLSSFSKDNLKNHFESLNYNVYFCDYNHETMIQVLEKVQSDINGYFNGSSDKLPLIILNIHKGETAPSFAGIDFSGTQKSHKNPLPNLKANLNEFEYLKYWLKSYKIKYEDTKLISFENSFSEILSNKKLTYYFIEDNKLTLKKDNLGASEIISLEGDNLLDNYVSMLAKNGDIFVVSPDELVSNKFSTTSNAESTLEILNENICQAIMQGLTNTNRRVLFNAYEAFMPIISGMFDQLCKWLGEYKKCNFGVKLPAYTYYLTSTCWENCYSHQNPSFINHTICNTFDFVNLYFPIDNKNALYCLEDCFKREMEINIITKSKSLRQNVLKDEQSKNLINLGYHIFNFNKENNLTVFVTGDYMFYAVNKILEIIGDKQIINKINLVYVYDLKKIMDKEIVSIFEKSQTIYYFFHGYESALKQILFDVTRKKIKTFGFRDACSRGSLNSKLIDNGIDTLKLAEEIKDLIYD